MAFRITSFPAADKLSFSVRYSVPGFVKDYLERSSFGLTQNGRESQVLFKGTNCFYSSNFGDVTFDFLWVFLLINMEVLSLLRTCPEAFSYLSRICNNLHHFKEFILQKSKLSSAKKRWLMQIGPLPIGTLKMLPNF